MRVIAVSISSNGFADRHRPVAAEGDDRAALLHARDRVHVRRRLLADERQRQVGDVGVGVGPERLEVRDHAELAEARLVVRVDQLDVRDVVAVAEVAVRRARRLDRVQRLAHRAVADRVEVHLESVGVELRDRLLEQFRLDHRDAAHVLLALQLVGLEHDGRVILHHAVLHDLDGAGVDAALRVLAAQVLDGVDLLEPLVALPPDRADDAQRELAGLVEAVVGLEVLLVDRGVLHAGDAEAVQHLDRVAQAGVALRVGVGGRLVGDEAARAFLQAADRLAGLRVAVDAAVRRDPSCPS